MLHQRSSRSSGARSLPYLSSAANAVGVARVRRLTGQQLEHAVGLERQQRVLCGQHAHARLRGAGALGDGEQRCARERTPGLINHGQGRSQAQGLGAAAEQWAYAPLGHDQRLPR